MLNLILDITTPPHPETLLLLADLLGCRGPNIIKPVLCLEPSPWAWVLGGSGQGLYCLMEVPPLLLSLYKSSEPFVMSGEVGWTAGSMHLCHALGTSQVWAHALTYAYLRGADFNHVIGALGAHVDHLESGPTQGMNRVVYP